MSIRHRTKATKQTRNKKSTIESRRSLLDNHVSRKQQDNKTKVIAQIKDFHGQSDSQCGLCVGEHLVFWERQQQFVRPEKEKMIKKKHDVCFQVKKKTEIDKIEGRTDGQAIFLFYILLLL